MKVTLNIANPLLAEAKAVARKKKITVRALVERGLKLALAEHEDRRAIKLRDASVTGKGLRPDAAELSWDQLRADSSAGHTPRVPCRRWNFARCRSERLLLLARSTRWADRL